MGSPARCSNWVASAHLTPKSSDIIAISQGLADLLSDLINLQPLSSLTRADRVSRESMRTSIDAHCSSIRCDGMDEESG
eukprot:348187-Ditylum_brightwellii.AAC.1